MPTVVAGTRDPLVPEVDLVAHDDYRGVDSRRRICWNSVIKKSHTSSEWARGAGSDGRATKHRSRMPVCAPFPRKGIGRGDRRAARPGSWCRSDRPTAILAANDLSAVGVLDVADELGLAVPADLSVVGYDNTAYSRLPRLSITTIDGHSAEAGQLAGRTLVARISGDASSVRPVSSRPR